jgi:hypothetical protein
MTRSNGSVSADPVLLTINKHLSTKVLIIGKRKMSFDVFTTYLGHYVRHEFIVFVECE